MTETGNTYAEALAIISSMRKVLERLEHGARRLDTIERTRSNADGPALSWWDDVDSMRELANELHAHYGLSE